MPVTAEIVVVGLGPADEAMLTLGTVRAIEAHEHRYLRTARHPAASAVQGHSPVGAFSAKSAAQGVFA